MSQVEINRVVDTVLMFLSEERPLYDSIIQRYLGPDYRMNLFKGARSSIADSNIPAIEVYQTQSSERWAYMRVPEDTYNITLEVTTRNADPSTRIDLEGKLVALTCRILSRPRRLRSQISGTSNYLLDTELPTVQYGATAGKGKLSVAVISWSGKALVALSNRDFEGLLNPQHSLAC
jgi:hypothetical protein